MKKDRKIPKSTERAEQNLPGDGAITLTGQESSARPGPAGTTARKNQAFHQPKQTRAQDDLPDGNSPDFALGGSMTEPPATRRARRTSHRDFEFCD